MEKERKQNPAWIEVISKYNMPDTKSSIWQIINSLGPYILLWIAMYYSLGISYLLTLGLAILAAGFLVRMFIIFHDCGHGSFFRSTRANRIVGTILGSLVFTPYDRWHLDHSIHHKTVGNLDKRGQGDVWTLTVEEYEQLSRRKSCSTVSTGIPSSFLASVPSCCLLSGFVLPAKAWENQNAEAFTLPTSLSSCSVRSLSC